MKSALQEIPEFRKMIAYSVEALQHMDKDPVREDYLARGVQPDLDEILRLFPPTTGAQVIDPFVIRGNIARLKTVPEVNTGHPFIDLSVKTGLAFIDATFQGQHPKYGLIWCYAEDIHDGFPPTIIAAVDALSTWGLNERAAELMRYWCVNLVRDDGTIKYFGPSIAELGQILDTAALLAERAGGAGWWDDALPHLESIAELLLRLRTEAEKEDGLIAGVPEADEKDKPGKFFHNNAWAVTGLQRWAGLCERHNQKPKTPLRQIRKTAEALAQDTLRAIHKTWPEDPGDRWLPPQTETVERPASATGTRLASYTNYRYWPELLSSGILPPAMANRVVEARLAFGGQFCGMTRFEDHLDDWPLADYLYGLWRLGRKNDFLLSLYGHAAYHQAGGHLTTYEQISFPPSKALAPYCLPCQLVVARAARLLARCQPV